MRRPFQGVTNIIRFNWPFYVGGVVIIAGVLALPFIISNPIMEFRMVFLLLVVVFALALIAILISLVVSWYVYDYSSLYSFAWLMDCISSSPQRVINIHAGFDETSALLRAKYPRTEIEVFDFYDASKHTEPSIRRARKAYPTFPGTRVVTTDSLPSNNSADVIFLILAAHEIRNDDERILFFMEVRRLLGDDGRIVVVEHLRDASNFFAYNVGFFHFHSHDTWRKTFTSAGLRMCEELKITPFISAFVLERNGTPS